MKWYDVFLSLAAIIIMAAVGWVMFAKPHYEDQRSFAVECFNTKGEIKYEAVTKTVPSIYRSVYMTCVVTRLEETK